MFIRQKKNKISLNCLICGSIAIPHNFVTRRLLIKEFKSRFGISVKKNNLSNKYIYNFKCQECSFIFFNEKEGDEDFYNQCKKSSSYFEQWRWEFSIVLEKIKNNDMTKLHLDVGSGNGIFASSLSGFVHESWAQDYVVPEILNPNVYFSFLDGENIDMILEKSKIKKVEGHMYEYNIPPGLISEDNRNYSELILSEDGKTLISPSSYHASIKGLGLGRYSHWANLFYFSSSDNSDPRSNGKVYRLNTNRVQNNYFDSISIFHTLEHVKNPLEFMNTVKKYVKHNGSIFISVPNANSRYRELFDSKQEIFDILNYPPHHLTWWRPEDLVELAIRCGLRPIRLYFEILGASGLNCSIRSNISRKSRNNLFYENEIQGEAYLNGILYANFIDCNKTNQEEILNQGFTMLIEIKNLL